VTLETSPTSRPASEPIRPVLYPLLRIIGNAILRTFLRKIAVHVEHPIAELGPIIFASNHPNGLLDPLSIGYVTRRPVHFLAKSGIFAVPVWGSFLRRCGVLPVYRRMDSPVDMSKNERTFEACYQVLAAGGAIGIFPEGVSHVNPELKKLKTGAARIALEAEERYDFRLGVRLVPVGLTFPERSRFRSTLGIQVGKAISLEPYYEHYSKEPQETVREVTHMLQETIKTQMLHLDHLELAGLFADIDSVYREDLIEVIRESGSPLGSTSDPIAVQRRIADAVEYFYRHEPRVFERTDKRVRRYMTGLRRLRLRDEALRDFEGRLSWFVWLAGVVPWALIGLPIAFYGTVNNFLPWLLTRGIARRLSKTPQSLAQSKIYSGMAVFPVFYAIQIYGCWRWLGTLPAVVYGMSLPILGLFAVGFWRRTRAVWRILAGVPCARPPQPSPALEGEARSVDSRAQWAA
jgi:1-acyl-sn-glycerol-3-phosphate acyltransferase